ncbi:hypothetical protein HDU76_006885 [Blyttiomyces sp. JEL0837]|nr:hypothetical protein HDU76_006885 [Blyttiomyces sp. JEL0837]
MMGIINVPNTTTSSSSSNKRRRNNNKNNNIVNNKPLNPIVDDNHDEPADDDDGNSKRPKQQNEVSEEGKEKAGGMVGSASASDAQEEHQQQQQQPTEEEAKELPEHTKSWEEAWEEQMREFTEKYGGKSDDDLGSDSDRSVSYEVDLALAVMDGNMSKIKRIEKQMLKSYKKEYEPFFKFVKDITGISLSEKTRISASHPIHNALQGKGFPYVVITGNPLLDVELADFLLSLEIKKPHDRDEIEKRTWWLTSKREHEMMQLELQMFQQRQAQQYQQQQFQQQQYQQRQYNVNSMQYPQQPQQQQQHYQRYPNYYQNYPPHAHAHAHGYSYPHPQQQQPYPYPYPYPELSQPQPQQQHAYGQYQYQYRPEAQAQAQQLQQQQHVGVYEAYLQQDLQSEDVGSGTASVDHVAPQGSSLVGVPGEATGEDAEQAE